MINSSLQGLVVHSRSTRPRLCRHGLSLLSSLLPLLVLLGSVAATRSQQGPVELQQVPLVDVLRDYHQYLDQLEEAEGPDDDLTQFTKRQGGYSFGLGKRHQDYSFGLGKRSPDYSFGLGKRVPDYAFGLGKRSPDYAFGLGKRSPDYAFGLGKRSPDYAFGLGKRSPDYAFGLGKRSPDYAFGLGKRVQDYAFGLGKRSGNDYSFGLGKRSTNDYSFGLGKRVKDFSFGLGKRSHAYAFGLGKRDAGDDGVIGNGMTKHSTTRYPKFKSYSMGLGKRSIKDTDLEDEKDEIEAGLQDAHQKDVRHKRDVAAWDETPDADELQDHYVDEKRHNMYEFGLGKRAYDGHKFDFGLGKRDFLLSANDDNDYPKRIPGHYSFGLGKRAGAYEFGIGKRLSPEYNFGIGKRFGDTQMKTSSQSESRPGNEFYKSRQPKTVYPLGFGRRSFDFGLGKRSGGGYPGYTPPKRPSRDFAFGLGKRRDVGGYSFGLGKRDYEEEVEDSPLDQDGYVLQEIS